MKRFPKIGQFLILILLGACGYERVDWTCSCASTYEGAPQLDAVEGWAMCGTDTDVEADLDQAADECELMADEIQSEFGGSTLCDCRCDTEEEMCDE